MPIYEYHCGKCGDFEAMQKMSDKPLTQCPTCRRKVTKLISATSFQLKGSGWYITDYARKDSGKSDAKPEKKGEQSKKGDSKKTPAAARIAAPAARRPPPSRRRAATSRAPTNRAAERNRPRRRQPPERRPLVTAPYRRS